MLAWHAQPCERALMATAGTDCEGVGRIESASAAITVIGNGMSPRWNT
jgi:hypothetical protein